MRAGSICILFFILLIPSIGKAENSTGIGYVAKSNRQIKSFTFSHREEVKGKISEFHNVYTAMDGKEAVKEDVFYENDIFQRMLFTQGQLGDTGSIEVRGDQVFFEYKHNGKTKKSSEKFTNNFATGPSLLPYVKKHWNEILEGKTVEIRMGIVDRCETIGFKIFKDKERIVNGKEHVILKMKPTSIVIAAIVEPLFFVVDKKEVRLDELMGRVVVKSFESGSWKDVDGEVVYTY